MGGWRGTRGTTNLEQKIPPAWRQGCLQLLRMALLLTRAYIRPSPCNSSATARL